MRSSRSTPVKIGLILISLVFVYISLLGKLENSRSEMIEIFEESGVKNVVTSVYLYQRLYDTVFEVLVFSLVVVGITVPTSVRKGIVEDEVFRSVSRFMAFFLAVSSVYLALTGHVYPGGGFTAGVVGGTALLLMGISRGIETFEREFERFRVPTMEKFVFVLIVLSSIFTIVSKSAGLVPVVNFLIYFKVMAGTWMITYEFVRHRGII